MKVPELIKNAVEKQDWKLVCAVYTAITGEPLSPPEPKSEKPNFLDMDISPELLRQLGIDSQDDEGVPSVSNEENLYDAYEHTLEDSKKKVDNLDFTIQRGKKIREDGKVEAARIPLDIPSKRENRFVDNLEVAASELQKENPTLQKLYGPVKKHSSKELIVDRVDTSIFVDVECSLCGHTEKVSKALSRGYSNVKRDNIYRCNACSTPSGKKRLKIDEE